MSAKLKLGFLGAGKMATALAKGFVNAKLLTPELILASDLDKERKLELLHSLASREAVEAALEDAPVLAAKGEGA